MSSSHDQQPLRKTVGHRRSREGRPLTTADREAMTKLANYRTRAPKGIFFYSSHDEMEADRLRWQVEAIVAKARRS